MNDIVTEPITEPVTRPDINALLHSDTIVFRLYKGQATVEAYLRANSPGNTTGYEQHRIINAGGPRIHDYDRENGFYVVGDEWHRYSGFESTSIYSDLMRTLVSRIRVGSTLSLMWDRGGYSNEVTKKAGLVVDHVKLVITPHGKDGTPGKAETYLVAVHCGLDNSARMVKLDWNGV